MLNQTMSLFSRPSTVFPLTQRKREVLQWPQGSKQYGPPTSPIAHFLDHSPLLASLFSLKCVWHLPSHFTILYLLFPLPGTCFLDICMLVPHFLWFLPKCYHFSKAFPGHHIYDGNPPQTFPSLLYYPPLAHSTI